MRSGLPRALTLTFGGLCGLAAFNTWCHWTAGPAYNRLGGRPVYYEWPAGRVFYAADGDGEPLVLVHRPSWAAASFEWRRVFARLAAHYRVYALDLPGFGLSDRPATHYDAALYIRLLGDFLRTVVARPSGVVASGLSAAYAIAAAAHHPGQITRLVLVSPTWGAQDTFGPALARFLRLPVAGTSIFNIVASRRALRYLLEERTYYDPTLVDEDVIEAAYAACQRPGSPRAAAALLAGQLAYDASVTWPMLRQPALVVYGQDAPTADIGALLAETRPGVRHAVLPASGLLPHDEQPERFVREVLTL